MRTLQEKYNAIQEGKFSKEHFLAEARMQQPHLITRFNGYDDAVKILKNKGMIREAYSTEESFKDYSDDALADIIINSSRFEGNEEVIARVKAELERRKEAIKEASYKTSSNSKEAQHLKKGDIITSGDEVVSVSAGAKTPAGKVEVTLKTKSGSTKTSTWGKTTKIGVKPVTEARLTNKSLTDYRYKPTNEMDKYPYEQILRGLRVELEGLSVHGTPTADEYKKALGKVLKNLEKDEIFYTNRVAGIKAGKDLHDKMIEADKKNTVDTFNGLKKAELKEGFKKLIKKVLSEEIEEEFQLQEAKEDSYYKSELSDYLDDNGIFGYTDRIHSIMTSPDEAENVDELVRFLEDNQIYGYGSGIERIYADYPYDQHWMNQEDEDDDELDDSRGLFKGFRDDEDDEDEDDDISHPRGYEEASDEEDFDDLFEGEKSEKEVRAEWEKYQATSHPEDRMSYMEWRSEQGLDEAIDTEADKNMVRKFMAMYETEPSKFEKLHKQAQTQAATTKDIKFKHLLSLFNRAKAGALQSLANQDRYQAGIEGMDEIATDITGFPKWRELGQDEKDHISKFVKDTGDRDQAEYEKRKAERLKAQSDRLSAYIASKKDLEENIFKSVSLKDIL